jgi:hypothetical protein
MVAGKWIQRLTPPSVQVMCSASNHRQGNWYRSELELILLPFAMGRGVNLVQELNIIDVRFPRRDSDDRS